MASTPGGMGANVWGHADGAMRDLARYRRGRLRGGHEAIGVGVAGSAMALFGFPAILV